MYSEDENDIPPIGSYTDAVMCYELLHQVNTEFDFSVDELQEIINYYKYGYKGKGGEALSLKALNMAIRQHPNNLDFYLEKVDKLKHLKRYEEAMHVLYEASKHSADVEITIEQASILALQGNKGEAKQILEELIKQASSEEEEHEFYSSAMLTFLRAGDYHEAIRYQCEYARLSNCSDAWDMVAFLQYHNGNFKDGLQALLRSKELAKYPMSAYSYVHLAQYYTYNNRYPEALDLIEGALKKTSFNDEDMARLLFEKLELLLDLDRVEEALAEANQYFATTEFSEYSLQILYQKAACYEYLEQLDEALQSYNTLIQEYTDKSFTSHSAKSAYEQAMVNIASLYFEMGEYSKANEQLAICLAERPKDEEALLLKGRMQTHHLEFIAAEKTFRKILAKNVKFIDAWLCLADCKLLQNDVPAAIKILQRSLFKNKNVHEPLYRLATLFYVQQRMTSCLFFLKQGFEMNIRGAEDFFSFNPEAKNNAEIMQLYQTYTLS
ncbi:MAG: tetratricopeptide repeat protein [Bacteroidales bacterium]